MKKWAFLILCCWVAPGIILGQSTPFKTIENDIANAFTKLYSYYPCSTDACDDSICVYK